MEIIIINEFKTKLKLSKQLKYICQLLDKKLGKLAGTLNVVFCDDKTICRLNKKYRQLDKNTDVLTFTYYEGESSAYELLGEIIIDVEQAVRQAQANNIELKSELYKLFIHGLLHLRGFDHKKDSDFRVMKLLEEEIMGSFQQSSFF